MSQPVGTFTGDALYLDTMVFYILLRAISPDACMLFRDVQQGKLRAYTSVLTFDELVYRMLLASIQDQYGGSPLDRLRQNERQVITEFYPQLRPKLEQVQTYPHLALVDVTASDLTVMRRSVLEYNLRPRDALHLAAMQKVGCLDLVSHDTDFDHVPGVHRYTLT